MKGRTPSAPITVQPPVKVAVRQGRYVSTDKARVRGRIVGVAFDEYGGLNAYAILDDTAPLVSPYGVTENGGGWPMEGDEFVGIAQGWHLALYGQGMNLNSGMPIFVYAQVLPEDDMSAPARETS